MNWTRVGTLTMVLVGTWVVSLRLPLSCQCEDPPDSLPYYCAARATLYLARPDGVVMVVRSVGPRRAYEVLGCTAEWRYAVECLAGRHSFCPLHPTQHHELLAGGRIAGSTHVMAQGQ